MGYWARSIQPKFPEISVKNSMDRFGPTGNISMYSYDRSVVALQAKCMFWLLTGLKDDLFPERICNVLFVIRFKDFD